MNWIKVKNAARKWFGLSNQSNDCKTTFPILPVPDYIKTIWQYEDQIWFFWHLGKKIGCFDQIEEADTGEVAYSDYKAIDAWAYVVEYFYSFHQNQAEISGQMSPNRSYQSLRHEWLLKVKESLIKFIFDVQVNQSSDTKMGFMGKCTHLYIHAIEDELQNVLTPFEFNLRKSVLVNYQKYLTNGSQFRFNFPHPLLLPKWFSQLESDLTVSARMERPTNIHTVLEEYFRKRDAGLDTDQGRWKELFQEKANCMTTFKRILPILGNDQDDWTYQMILVQMWFIKMTDAEAYLFYNQALECNYHGNWISFGNLLYFFLCRDCHESSLLQKLEKDALRWHNDKCSLGLGELWSREAFELPVTEFSLAFLCDEFQGKYPALGNL